MDWAAVAFGGGGWAAGFAVLVWWRLTDSAVALVKAQAEAEYHKLLSRTAGESVDRQDTIIRARDKTIANQQRQMRDAGVGAATVWNGGVPRDTD